jgi:molybdopterin-biosynthesis enzyme MoeA-like protein
MRKAAKVEVIIVGNEILTGTGTDSHSEKVS